MAEDRTKLFVALATIATALAALVTALFGPGACTPRPSGGQTTETSTSSIVWRSDAGDPGLIDRTLPQSAAGKEIRMSVYATAIRELLDPEKEKDYSSRLWLTVKLNNTIVCESPKSETKENGTFSVNFGCNFKSTDGVNPIKIEAYNKGAQADEVIATIKYDT